MSSEYVVVGGTTGLGGSKQGRKGVKMKGTIKIEANGRSDLSIEMNMISISMLDRLVIVDALVNAFELSEKDRTIFGATIAVGGLKEVMGKGPDMVKIDMGLIDKFRRESEQP